MPLWCEEKGDFRPLAPGRHCPCRQWEHLYTWFCIFGAASSVHGSSLTCCESIHLSLQNKTKTTAQWIIRCLFFSPSKIWQQRNEHEWQVVCFLCKVDLSYSCSCTCRSNNPPFRWNINLLSYYHFWKRTKKWTEQLCRREWKRSRAKRAKRFSWIFHALCLNPIPKDEFYLLSSHCKEQVLNSLHHE